MSYLILGNTDSPQAVDTEAVASVQMRRNRGVFQLVFVSTAGVMLGLYAVPRVSDAGVERSDAEYKRHADDEFRKVLEILKAEKPKSRQEFHNYAGFEVAVPEPIVEEGPVVGADAEAPPTEPTEE